MNDYVKEFMTENSISKDLEGVLRAFFEFIYGDIFDEGYNDGYIDGLDENDFDGEGEEEW